MKTVGLQHYLAIRQGAEVLERDGHGEKVLHLADGSILKLFRRKRLISSAALYPYAQRFADNCAALRKLGVPAPEVIEVFRIPEMKRDAVCYLPVPGHSLRQLHRGRILSAADEASLSHELAKLVRRLQDLGIYFRSLHLGNVILMPGGELALIDVADMKIHGRPLSAWLRRRNITRMLAIADESELRWFDSIRGPVRG